MGQNGGSSQAAGIRQRCQEEAEVSGNQCGALGQPEWRTGKVGAGHPARSPNHV